MPGLDPFASVTGAVLDLLTRDGDLFLQLGTNLFRGLAVILVVWFGVRAAMTAAEGRGAIPFAAMSSLILTIAFGSAMIRFYRAPLPLIGVSFTQLLTDQPLFLAHQLESTQVQRLSERLNEVYLTMEMPSVANISALIGYFVVALAVTAARAALLAVVAFGLVATGVAVLVGPVFIPFFIVPKMEWLFCGWFTAFLQYSFYPVVANAYLFVFGNMLVHLVDSHPPPYDGPTIALLFAPLLFLLIAFVHGIVKIPSLVSSLFSGSSGESVIPKIL